MKKKNNSSEKLCKKKKKLKRNIIMQRHVKNNLPTQKFNILNLYINYRNQDV